MGSCDHSSSDNFFRLDGEQTAQSFLQRLSEQWQMSLADGRFAKAMDAHDPLRHMRQEFCYPKMSTLPDVDRNEVELEEECTYLCGQSLGLMPVRTKKAVNDFLHDWATLGVCGHFAGSNPWAECDKPCLPVMSRLVGARIQEVAVMNQLSSNLHFMMTTFYRPKGERFKILYEENAFPSDQYAINSQLRLHGYDPNLAKVVLRARQGESCLRTEDILEVLRREGPSIALVLIGGVHYYTGQLFEMETITRAAHEQGCCVGWDLAHAVGNVPLQLHDWQVDFAAWCTYKYLNSGAGCIGGIFIHSNHLEEEQLPRLDGWWGNRESTRFDMLGRIDRDPSANGFRVSNPSIHQCAALGASLQVFEEAGMEQLRSKSILLTQYLQSLMQSEFSDAEICQFTQLTPVQSHERGAQLSFRPQPFTARQIHDELLKVGVLIDIRDDIIRVAPAPLYNSFADVLRFVSLLKKVLLKLQATRSA